MQYYFFFLTSSISYKLYVFLSNEIRISLQRCLLGKPGCLPWRKGAASRQTQGSLPARKTMRVYQNKGF